MRLWAPSKIFAVSCLRTLGVSLLGCGFLGLFLLPVVSFAGDLALSALTPGSYLPEALPCAQLGGASTSYFDGRNFSEHYQYCVTGADITKTHGYKQTCVEHQGPNPPTTADILKAPDRTSFALQLQVNSPTTFTLRDRKFRLCK